MFFKINCVNPERHPHGVIRSPLSHRVGKPSKFLTTFTKDDRQNSMKKVIKRILIGLAVIMAIMIVTSYVLAISTRNRVAELRKEITDNGDYLEITDYPLTKPADDQNGFIYLQQAADSLAALDLELNEASLNDSYSWDNGKTISEENLSNLETILNQYTELFATLETAAGCQGFRSEFNPAEGFAALLPHLTQIRGACRTLALKALVEAKRGRGDSAMASCETMIRIGKFVDLEPLLIGHLVGVACTSMSLSTANHVVSIANVSDESIDKFLNLLDSIDTQRSVTEALKGERAIAVMTFQQIRDGRLGDDFGNAIPTASQVGNRWLTEAYLNDDERNYLTLMSKQIRWIKEPKAIRGPKMAAVIDELETSSFRFMLSKLILPALSNVAIAKDRIEAEIRCFRLILVSRKSNAPAIDSMEFPSPQDLDPFTQERLLMRKDDRGWIVYSVGENLTDDGGAIWKTEDTDRPLDIGFGSVLAQ